ncbi:MAG: hypothetical protein E7660_07590 [Ruminococcaceae bacterium]|nr:hypothetical protein [Oscillospiraceae bacterium]
MRKNNEWYAVINDVERYVVCDVDTKENKYTITVDDELITSGEMKPGKKLSREGMEVPFEIDGVECRFIIWNNLPDLAVNGILLSCDRDYKEVRRQIAINMLSQCLSSALVGFVVLVLVTVGFLTKKLSVYAFVPVLFPCAIFLIRALAFYIKYKAFVNAAKKTDGSASA